MIAIEYKGKKYSSIRALAVAYGKNPVAVYARLKQTNDIEYALNQEKKWSLKTITDHLGMSFVLCLLSVSITTFQYRDIREELRMVTRKNKHLQSQQK